MGSLGPAHLVALLLVVAIVSATCGFTASAVARRHKKRARRVFLLGFVCGYVAGPVLRKRRRGLNALTTAVSQAVAGQSSLARRRDWVHSR